MLVPDSTAQGHGAPALQWQKHVAAEEWVTIGDGSKLAQQRLVAEERERGREGRKRVAHTITLVNCSIALVNCSIALVNCSIALVNCSVRQAK